MLLRFFIIPLVAAVGLPGARPSVPAAGPESVKLEPLGTVGATTLPANALRSGENTATFDIEQDDHTVVPDPNGIYHIHPAPFAVHLRGDIVDVAVTASHNDKLITALAAEKRPILTLVGTGCAYSPGDLLVNDASSLAGFETFKAFFEKDAALYEKLLPARLGALPVVLDASMEYSTAYAPPDAADYIQKFDTLYKADGSLFGPAAATTRAATDPPAALPKLDWESQTDLYLTLLINSPAEVAKFKRVSCQGVHVRFDLK